MTNEPKPHQADDTNTAPPEEDVVDGLRKRMRPFLVLFGSAAAIATFLLFAGFLSDFAVYQLADLPRLDFSYTALVESGAAVLVDTLSLLVASPARVITLLLLFVFLVSLWAYRETPRLKRFAHSLGIYQTLRLILFLYAALLLAGQLGLIQRGLHPEDREQLITTALDAAYREADGGIPDPRARLRAIERIDYQITAFPFPNWAERWLEGSSRTDTQEWQEAAGLPLRLLPESRQAAAHVFGWLAISLLILLLSVVLLQGWFEWLQKTQCSSEQHRDSNPASHPTWTHPALDEPVRYLIAPLTLVLCALSFALLPLSHGLLARSSLGNETVMVVLDSNSSDQNKSRTLKCLDEDSITAMETTVDNYRKALAHLIQNRPAEESAYEEANKNLREALSKLVDTSIAAECPLAVQTLWELHPSPSLSQTYPELAAVFRTEITRALLHYGVRVGTLLSYPRDEQPLTLIETLQARTADSGGQWALASHERKNVREVVVLPNTDTLALKIADYKRSMIQNPNSDAKEPLLRSQDAAALAATLELLKNRYLYVSHAGVAVTSLGGMAQANLNDRPDLSRNAIDLLTDIASSSESKIWPDKENNIRSAAVTALHLTRSPYAAYKLAEELRKDKDKSCDGKLGAIRCVPGTSTAAGFLLSDLTAEARLLPLNQPKAITATRDALMAYLLKLSMDEKASDDHRSTACSAINISGVRNIATAQLSANFFTALQKMNPTHNPLALPVCVNAMSMLHMDSGEHRAFLHKLFFSQPPEQASAIDSYSQARRIALVTLSELGLAGESDFLFHAYLESEPQMRDDVVSTLMDEGDPPALAGKLLDCVNTTWEKDEGRARLCLQGMQKIKDSYDGDEGATQRILALLHEHPASALKGPACEVLREFEKRNGLLARRLFREDPGYCPQSSRADEGEKLRLLLEALRKATSGAPQ